MGPTLFSSPWKDRIFNGVFVGVLLALLYASSLYSYLLFHSLVEIFSVVIACSVFMLAWNSRDFLESHFLLFLGIAYLFVAAFTLLHALTYRGMGVFPEYDADLPTQLWIAARYLESLSLLGSVYFLRRKINPPLVMGGYLALCAILLFLIFTRRFPSCFNEQSGLTSFKIISEYLICLTFALTIAAMAFQRRLFEPGIFTLLTLALVLSILAELSFTLYTTPFGFINKLGHFIGTLSFIMIYKALIESGLRRPYQFLFRDLKDKEIALQRARVELVARLHERDELIEELKKAASEIKTLGGLIPICAECKKIRNDKGYWGMLETYFMEHSDAQFSHGICPECARKLYPEYVDDLEDGSSTLE
ncbi:MAG: hypothetical protein GC154_19850 [bacterium]|nr:hypothetical protein [bacterium]